MVIFVENKHGDPDSIMDFVVSFNNGVKIKENEKNIKYLDLAREQ